MNNEQSSYRSIMKATSVYGGAQFLGIIISVIRTKCIALFLGAAGMGIVGLLTSALLLIGGLTNFGLATSAVRDISIASASADENRVALVVNVMRRWVWVTGIFGAVAIIILSPILSRMAFETSAYVWSFIFLSSTLLFNQLNAGQLVLLQGLQKIKYLAKASIAGNISGLLLTLPLYYYLGNAGIVPAMITTAVVTLGISWYFASKIHIKPMLLTNKVAVAEGKSMLKMGFLINLSAVLVIITTYILQLFISNTGNIAQVGLYTAGFAMINTYVGIVFSSMSTSYFPKLSAVSHSNEQCKICINQQAEMSILFLGPIVMFFLVFAKFIIVVLYSAKFIIIEEMVMWVVLATFLKAGSWAIALILLAKGASKLFFWNELVANAYILIFDILAYHFFGLKGLGISYFLAFLLYFIQVYVLSSKKYNFSFDHSFIKIFIIQFSLAVFCFFVSKFLQDTYAYMFGIFFICCSIIHSYKELDKRIDLKGMIGQYFKTKNTN